jgi:flagellar biosynthesis protein FliQ
MNATEVVQIGRDALGMVLLLGGPTLVAAVVIGTGISILQAVTQVHEQTLTFLPKLVIVGGVLVLSSGWMLEQMVAYGERSFDQIRTVGAGE